MVVSVSSDPALTFLTACVKNSSSFVSPCTAAESRIVAVSRSPAAFATPPIAADKAANGIAAFFPMFSIDEKVDLIFCSSLSRAVCTFPMPALYSLSSILIFASNAGNSTVPATLSPRWRQIVKNRLIASKIVSFFIRDIFIAERGKRFYTSDRTVNFERLRSTLSAVFFCFLILLVFGFFHSPFFNLTSNGSVS